MVMGNTDKTGTDTHYLWTKAAFKDVRFFKICWRLNSRSAKQDNNPMQIEAVSHSRTILLPLLLLFFVSIVCRSAKHDNNPMQIEAVSHSGTILLPLLLFFVSIVCRSAKQDNIPMQIEAVSNSRTILLPLFFPIVLPFQHFTRHTHF